jgi:hypothetical protein
MCASYILGTLKSNIPVPRAELALKNSQNVFRLMCATWLLYILYTPTQHLLLSFSKEDGMCLLRGTKYISKYSSGYSCEPLTNTDSPN